MMAQDVWNEVVRDDFHMRWCHRSKFLNLPEKRQNNHRTIKIYYFDLGPHRAKLVRDIQLHKSDPKTTDLIIHMTDETVRIRRIDYFRNAKNDAFRTGWQPIRSDIFWLKPIHQFTLVELALCL